LPITPSGAISALPLSFPLLLTVGAVSPAHLPHPSQQRALLAVTSTPPFSGV